MRSNSLGAVALIAMMSARSSTVHSQEHPQAASSNASVTATVVSDAPVYLEPDASRPPLRVAKAGSILRFLVSQGDWVNIEFQDPQYGRRVGYIRAALVRIDRDSARLEPMDLSVGAVTQASPRTNAVPIRVLHDGLLDEISLYADRPPTDVPVLIRLFSATDSDLGTGDIGGSQAQQSATKVMQGQGPKLLADQFVTKLKKIGPYASVSAIEQDSEVSSNAIVVEGTFITLDPGSRAKRYFVGFGAGKSTVAVAGSVVTADGTVLALFSHRRIGVIGVGGGDSLGKMSSDARDIGGDIATFLNTWVSGGKLK